MKVPEKFSIVGYWHPNCVHWRMGWHSVSHYILLDKACESVNSYFVQPLKPISSGGRRIVRRRLKSGDAELVTREEYERRWDAELLRLEQEEAWRLLSKK